MSLADDVLKDQHARIQKTLEHFKKELMRVPVPALTEERRKEIVKQVKHKGEEQKLAIRNERRDAKELIEQAEKDGEVAADVAKKAMEKVQKATDDGVKKVDE